MFPAQNRFPLLRNMLQSKGKPMAKRKRLSFDGIGLETKALTFSEPGNPPRGPALGQAGPAPRSAPISQVVGDASAQAALAALTSELEEARLSGRLILRVALDQIDDAHLTRDRMRVGADEMEDLIASLRERGQQMPLEVTALPDGRFGLISGWRRLHALRHLHTETGDARFAGALAIVRAPETLAHAYRAMVEENEIRAGISYYERARIAALAAEAGVYPDARAAIAGLFAAASRAKRSKIASFLVIWQNLDSRLRFGPAISERLGLALAKAIDSEEGFARRLGDRLRKATIETASDEIALLEKALNAGPERGPEQSAESEKQPQPLSPTPVQPAPSPAPLVEEICPGIVLESVGGFSQVRLTLSGRHVDGPFRDRLIAWIRSAR
jgi:hypothetical protein